MPRIELIFDADCPNVDGARQALREACRRAGLEPTWVEWDRDAPQTPDVARRFGSPTVLVDGRDAAGPGAEGDASACRVYRGDGGLQGVPPVALLVEALTGR